MNRLSKALLSGMLFILLLITGVLALSYDARDWVATYLHTSHVENAPPTPPFSVPLKDSRKKYLEFIAIGDAGTGAFGQRITAEAMRRKAQQDGISFVLYLGDNFYEFGVSSVNDRQWQAKFERIYIAPPLDVPFYAVLGNHDYRQNPQAQVEYTRMSERWKMPERYYTFTVAADESTGVQFFCLDTQPMAYLSFEEIQEGTDSASYLPQLRWLEQALSGSHARWKIAAGHHPLYSNGDHGDNRELASLLEPLFAMYSVDFYVAGHDHDLQLHKPVRGVTYVVSGAGAKHRDVTWRDNLVFAATNLGFTLFRISGDEAVVEFIDRNGITTFAKTFSRLVLTGSAP